MHRTYVHSQRHVERQEGWFDANDPRKYVSEYHVVSMDRRANPFMDPPFYENFNNSKQMDYGLHGSTNDPYVKNGGIMEQKMMNPEKHGYGRVGSNMAMKTSPAKNHNNVMVHNKQEDYDDDDDDDEEEYSSDDDHYAKNGAMMEQKMMNNHEKHGYAHGHVLAAKPEYHDYRFGPNMAMRTASQAKNHENHGYSRDHVLHAKPEYHDYRFGPNMSMKTASQKNHNNAIFHEKEVDDDDDEYSSGGEEESSDEELVENMKRMGTMEKTTKVKRTIMW